MNNKVGFKVIDAHTHVAKQIQGYNRSGEMYHLGGGKIRWANGEEKQLMPKHYDPYTFTHDMLVKQLDAHGVSKAILMQGNLLGFCNEYTHEAQEKYNGKLYGMGTFDPYGEGSEKIMHRLIEEFKFKGLKFEMGSAYGFMSYHPDFKVDGQRMRNVLDYAKEKELVISLDMGTFGDKSCQIEGLGKIARDYKSIDFVIEHIFAPAKNQYKQFGEALKALKKYENVNFTTASIPISTQPEAYPFPSTCEYLKIAKETIGTQRLLWGSDIPTVIVYATYFELMNYIVESKVFSDGELEGVFANNAERVYKI